MSIYYLRKSLYINSILLKYLTVLSNSGLQIGNVHQSVHLSVNNSVNAFGQEKFQQWTGIYIQTWNLAQLLLVISSIDFYGKFDLDLVIVDFNVKLWQYSLTVFSSFLYSQYVYITVGCFANRLSICLKCLIMCELHILNTENRILINFFFPKIILVITYLRIF